MATKKPRINITLDGRCYDIIKSLSQSTGRPMSGFIAEMIEAASPTLERMAATFQKVKSHQDLERSKFLEGLDEAQAALEPVALEAIGQFDLFMGKIDAAVEERRMPGAARGRRSASAPGTTPTNRGVTRKTATLPKPNNGKALKGVPKKEVFSKKGVPNVHKKGGKSHAL